MYFRLKPYIYATKCDIGIIILDLKRDKYFSLTDTAAAFFEKIVSLEFNQEDSEYKVTGQENQSINTWIDQFLNQDFIEPRQEKDFSKPLRIASQSGGLKDYQWDRKETFSFFSKASKLSVLRLLPLIMQVDFTLRRKGIQGILKKIEKHKDKRQNYREPSKEEITKLSDALDTACSLYPKKLYCLAWASVFVLAALKRGWKCSIVIGVQSPPFYAHAWAEAQEEVINDAPQVREYLSVLLKEPFK
jgi:hypothetical protein